jgi:integrase/recombinase XerD
MHIRGRTSIQITLTGQLEWFANLNNPRTRRAYRNDVKEFTAFAGVERPEEMRQVTRAHLIAWL